MSWQSSNEGRRHRRPPKQKRGNDYYEDSDEENAKGHKAQEVYNGACKLGRFCLNPCLCLATAARILCCRLQQQQQQQQQQGAARFYRQGGLLVLLIVCVLLFWPRQSRHPLRHSSDWSLDRMPILIKLFDFSSVNDIGGWHYHASARFHSISALEPLKRDTIADYGDIAFVSLQNASLSRRRIAPDDYLDYELYRKKLVHKMDEIYRGSNWDHEDETLRKCRRPNFASLYFPTCNNFHEFDLSRDHHPDLYGTIDLSYFDSYQFSHGYYRDAWMLRHPLMNNTTEGGVLKSLRMKHDYRIQSMFEVQMDALVMERLTSSPRILDMYGHCSTSIIVEPMPYEVEEYIVPGDGYAKQKDLDEYNNVKSMNHYSVAEKLQIALEMAESIADLHGYKGGVFVHDDVQLCQWLRNSEGKLKLGDFNRAEVMAWRDIDSSYCKYKNGYVYGNYRSPEEIRDDYLDEKIDVYSFGNNLYGLLTGLWPFYENNDDEVVQGKLSEGQRAFIDDRYRNHSYGEGKLVELIERCWIEDPTKRVDIFDAVRFLREAVEENKKFHDNRI